MFLYVLFGDFVNMLLIKMIMLALLKLVLSWRRNLVILFEFYLFWDVLVKVLQRFVAEMDLKKSVTSHLF